LDAPRDDCHHLSARRAIFHGFEVASHAGVMRATAGVLVVIGFLGAGCSYRVYSPPARALPLESPRPLPAGRTSVTAEGDVHSLLFGPSLVGGTLRVGRGVPSGELSAEATTMVVQGDSAAGTSPVIGMGRAGFRTGDRVFGFAAGLGGGVSAAGAFVSPDFAVMAGYENCYLVPFAALRSSVSVPLAPSTVDVGKPEDGRGVHLLRPRTTFAFSPTFGLKIPLFHRCTEDPQSRAALLVGLAWSALVDADHSDTYFGVGSGVTVNF
jgi:hypothetical protein